MHRVSFVFVRDFWFDSNPFHCEILRTPTLRGAGGEVDDQLRNDSIRPSGELWMRAVDRGHGDGTTTTRRSLPATRRR